MKEFLKKFLTPEQIAVVENAYLAKNTDATMLPTYIPKSRLDEVIKERDEHKTALDAIPKDWKTQLETSKNDVTKLTKDLADEKTARANDGKLFKAKAKNLTAVSALIDKTKPIDDEIKRLQKDEPYLFGDTGIPGGTGKGGEGNGGGNGGGGGGDEGLSEAKMRETLGLPPLQK